MRWFILLVVRFPFVKLSVSHSVFVLNTPIKMAWEYVIICWLLENQISLKCCPLLGLFRKLHNSLKGYCMLLLKSVVRAASFWMIGSPTPWCNGRQSPRQSQMEHLSLGVQFLCSSMQILLSLYALLAFWFLFQLRKLRCHRSSNLLLGTLGQNVWQ